MLFNKIKKDYLYNTNIDKSTYREFKNTIETKEWGNKFYSEWGKNYKKISKNLNDFNCCSIYCKNPVEAYCGYSYFMCNDYLRHNKNNFEDGILLTNMLIKEFYNANFIPENIIVYRMVCDEVIKELTSIKKDKLYTYCEKGFMSTSMLSSIVQSKEQYAQHNNLLKIYINKNTPGLYVNVITERSEEEILLLPNNILGLISPPYKDKKLNKTIYECVLLNFR